MGAHAPIAVHGDGTLASCTHGAGKRVHSDSDEKGVHTLERETEAKNYTPLMSL